MLNRYHLTLTTLTLLLSACGQTEKHQENQAAFAPENQILPKAQVIPKTETAASSIETIEQWTGDFKALLPCERCEQHVIHLRLNEDQSFELNEVQLFKQRSRENNVTGHIQAVTPKTISSNQEPSTSTADQWLLQTQNGRTYANIQLTAYGLELHLQQQQSQHAAKKVLLHPVENMQVSNALKQVDIQAEQVQSVAIKELNDPVIAHDYFLAIHNQSDQTLKLNASDLILVDQQYHEYAAVIEPEFLSPIPAQQKQWIKVSFHYPASIQADVIKIK